MTNQETNLIINFLPQSLSDEEFHYLFSYVGRLKSCKIIRDKKTGNSQGYGFADYFNPVDAARAIQQLNGHMVDGKSIKVAYAKKGENAAKGTKLIISNLPINCKNGELQERFTPFGTIIQARVLNSTASDQSIGAGFVIFSTAAEAEEAMRNMNGITLPGGTSALSIRIAKDNENSDAIPSLIPPLNPKPLSKPGPKSFGDNQYDPYAQEGFRGYPGEGRGYPEVPERVGYPGFGREYPEAERGYPEQRGYPDYEERYPPYERGYPEEYRDYYSRYARDGGRMYDRDADFYADAPDPIQYEHGRGGGPIRGRGRGRGGRHNPMAGGRARSVPDNSGYILFVYNIGEDAEEKNLWQMFGPRGTVSKVDIIMDSKKGKCKGYGFVTMPNLEEAENAIYELDGMDYNGKKLQVSFKKN